MTCDYIVIGAGSGGGVVSACLSECEDIRVLQLETGGPDEHSDFDRPRFGQPRAAATTVRRSSCAAANRSGLSGGGSRYAGVERCCENGEEDARSAGFGPLTRRRIYSRRWRPKRWGNQSLYSGAAR